MDLTVAIGEVCNFAAYAFAPAILVTPLGALSVLIGAVLGSYFLQETLGVLGRLGSAICLIGAVVIVLHAPPDEEIETIDQYLHYAIQPGMCNRILLLIARKAKSLPRLLAVRCRRRRLRSLHDLQSRTLLWQEECPHLPVDLFDCWLHLCHVRQGFRYRTEAYLRRQEPVHEPVNIRLHDLDCRLHSDADELLQQGSCLVPNQHVSNHIMFD